LKLAKDSNNLKKITGIDTHFLMESTSCAQC
jgi:hypothetical protein